MSVDPWPGPERPAEQLVPLAAGAVGLVAAVCVPLDRPGIGWAGTGLAAAGALAAFPKAAPVGVRQLAWAGIALALLATGAVRAADWLFVLCVLTAAVAAALALTNAATVRGMVLGVLATPAAVVQAIPWAGRGVRTRPANLALTGRVAVVGGVSAFLLVVFGSLFASADAAFASMLTRLTPDADTDQVVPRLFLFTVATLTLLGAAYLLVAPPNLTQLEAPARRRLRRFEWAVPVAALDLLFAAFVLVQLTVLFGGAEHVLGADGPTYAQYARSGFWQLLAVTILTLPVLALAARYASRTSRADRALIRILLGALAGLTLVIVASALYRMSLYQDAYGFTRLRILVFAAELWLGLVFAMVLAAGVRLRGGWLAQAAAGSAAAALLGLALLNPDRFIADRNVDRWVETGRIDVTYLSHLSADAVPALDRLPTGMRHCALHEIAAELDRSPDDWRGTNLARQQARAVLAARPVLTTSDDRPDCPHGR